MGERRAKAQVLIVDDDEKSREIIQLLLQRQGYDTREAESGEVALGMIGAQLPDLVLLDVEMGGIIPVRPFGGPQLSVPLLSERIGVGICKRLIR